MDLATVIQSHTHWPCYFDILEHCGRLHKMFCMIAFSEIFPNLTLIDLCNDTLSTEGDLYPTMTPHRTLNHFKGK